MVISESEFIFLHEAELLQDIPPHLFTKFSKRKEEIFGFFDKIPMDKAMKVKLPDEATWRRYNQNLRGYASRYKHDVSISARKEESGYVIYIKKKEKQDEKGVEK